jgi:alkylhydroperoxidase family enzyme
MAWIRKVPPEEATGQLKTIFNEEMERAGRIYEVVNLQSQNPGVLNASLGMYKAVMYGPSPLSRRQREMIATVVSCINRCHY